MQVLFCPDCILPYPEGHAADDQGRCSRCVDKIKKQEKFRQSINLIGIPPGECEGCGDPTLHENGVCQDCIDVGWKPGDVDK